MTLSAICKGDFEAQLKSLIKLHDDILIHLYGIQIGLLQPYDAAMIDIFHVAGGDCAQKYTHDWTNGMW